MRVNLKNAISFEIVDEYLIDGKPSNGFNMDTFRYDSDSERYFRKSRVVVDFGTFERTIWFDSDYQKDNFISEFLPAEIDYAIITNY